MSIYCSSTILQTAILLLKCPNGNVHNVHRLEKARWQSRKCNFDDIMTFHTLQTSYYVIYSHQLCDFLERLYRLTLKAFHVPFPVSFNEFGKSLPCISWRIWGSIKTPSPYLPRRFWLIGGKYSGSAPGLSLPLSLYYVLHQWSSHVVT